MIGIIRMWQEARGTEMRKEYEDIIRRIENANQSARGAFYNNIDATIEEMRNLYSNYSKSQRKQLLNQSRKNANMMWDQGDWPSSLGLAITCLNVEGEYVPGENAKIVQIKTAKIIEEAKKYCQQN